MSKPRRSAVAGVLSLSLLILGCPAAEPDAEEDDILDTRDVGSGVDSQIRPEDDARPAPREVISLVGMLPSDFPDDVWVYEPSSIVDLPAAASEERYMQCIRTALLSFARGDPPITSVEFARRNIEPADRPSFTELEEMTRRRGKE